MLESEQIATICKAADTPSDNEQVEKMRGMLGQTLDALAKSAERQALLEKTPDTRLLAALQVLELHKRRRR